MVAMYPSLPSLPSLPFPPSLPPSLSSLPPSLPPSLSSLPPSQGFKKEFDQYSQWLEGMEGKLAERRATKEPIGTITSQLEDHYVRGQADKEVNLQQKC